MKLQTLILLTVLLMASLILVKLLREAPRAAEREEYLVGGYNPITNINDPHVIEIAKFAVTQYDKQSGVKLKFKKVIKGESRVVAGINYRLTLSAGEGWVSKIYEAVVWEKPWLHFRNLTSFKPLYA
ncbi:cysteine proteinase inhibitor 5-like [Vicia villosa]|uniref:cysteine proteinase inhibitor 5-like n=1 Tax=Vicia villosa TaxID=3911 RepID=UPI00273A78ED|nr:cysteine proteinase inhibitor 5-like [Vicia villosa]